MDYMKNIYQSIYGHTNINSSAICTGKTHVNGGLRNYDEGAGSGIYYSIKNLVKDKNFNNIREKLELSDDLKKQTIIMSGFGNMGK